MKNPNRVAAGKHVSGHNAPKVCQYDGCRADFLGTGKQKYCSRACKEAAELVDRSPRPCPVCLATITPGRMGRRPVYCSRACKSAADNLPLTPRPCRWCRDDFTPHRGGNPRHHYCSPDCATAAASALKLAGRHGTPEQQAAALAAELQRRSNEQDPREA